jgi:hypothetical protein
VLAVEGLRAAIRDYEERHGLVEAREVTTMETIEKRLKHVMNPLSGLDLVRTNLVKGIDLEDGSVRVEIDLPGDHQFAKAIEEDIKEKIGPLWDIKNVTVEFSD